MSTQNIFVRAFHQKAQVPALFPAIATVILCFLAYFTISSAVEQRSIESQRNQDYISRTEKEKVLLLEAITDVDSAQMISAEDFRIIWSNTKFRTLLGKTKAELMHTNLLDIIPDKLALGLKEITKEYKFEKSNPVVSLEGYIVKDNEKVPVLVTFVSVEKSWTPSNDGYFIFTVLPSEEKVAFARSL